MPALLPSPRPPARRSREEPRLFRAGLGGSPVRPPPAPPQGSRRARARRGDALPAPAEKPEGVRSLRAWELPPGSPPLPSPGARSFTFALGSGCRCERHELAPRAAMAAAWGKPGSGRGRQPGRGSRAGPVLAGLSQESGCGHLLGRRREMGKMVPLHTWLLNPQQRCRAGG